MKALYFAWVREKIGKTEEDISPPGEVATVAELIAWLSHRGEEYQDAFATGTVRVAIDRTHVKHDASIGGAGEIAFFPPMTGG
jgi:molybdopterin synthase sulfur carrier subunit